MKKDKEWLKEEIKKLITEESQYMPHDEMVDLGLVLLTIDQLDEPEVKQLDKKIRELESYNDELIRDNNQLRNVMDNQGVLSQKWIDEHKYNHYIGKPFVYVDDLQNLIVPKQDKLIIPQFVADYIELNKGWSEDRQEYIEDGSSGLWFALNGDNQGMPNSVSDWLFNEEKVETFAKAWLDGYEVEKEKLYVVQLPTNLEDDLVILDVRGFIWKDTYPSKYKMTEQQIKDIDERYWAFAKEVTE